MEDRYGWEVVSAEYVTADCHWKTVVRKRKELKTVYFPQRVHAGQIVDLYRV